MADRGRVLIAVHLLLGGAMSLGPVSISAAAAAGEPESTLTIDHTLVACVLAGKFPRFVARIDPTAEVATARVYFRPGGFTGWYSVAMKPEANAFAAALPKPKPSLKSLDYYIEATDRAFGTRRTPEHQAQVMAGAGACKDKITASALGSASVLLAAPEGVASVPPGFASTGLVTAGTGAAGAGAGAGAASAGAAATGGAAAGAAAAGGGIGTSALVVAGAVAVGAGVAVAAGRDGGERSSLTGRWTGTLVQDEANGQCTANWDLVMNLIESGGRVTGDVQRTATSATFGIYLCAEPGSTLTGTMTDGTQAGNDVRLPVVFTGFAPGFGPYSFTWTFSGTVSADGRSMSGTLLGGNQTAPNNDTGPWMATRQ